MKKTSQVKKKAVPAGELRPEYNFDYANAKPNRFAKKFRPDAKGDERLDPFGTSPSVNAVWRLLMTPMPSRRTQEGPRG